MIVKLTSRGVDNDITKYVDVAPQVRDLSEFDSARVIISSIHKDALDGLDMARKVPLMSVVEINNKQYYVVSSDVAEDSNDYFTHTLDAAELAYLMTVRPVPNQSVTQPVEAYKVPAVVERFGMIGFIGIGANSTNSDEAHTYNEILASNDIGVVDFRDIKISGSFNISGTINVKSGHVLGTSDRLTDVWVELRANSEVVYRAEWSVLGETFGPNGASEAFNIDYEFDANDKISLWAGAKNNNVLYGKTLSFKIDDMRIYYNMDETYFADTIYLDEVIEKALLLNGNEILLNESAKARLANIKAFEDIFTDANLWDIVSRVARYVKAKPVVNYVGDDKYLDFIYFSDLAEQEWIDIELPERVSSGDVNEYTSTLVTKNNNIVKENTITEYLVLKTSPGHAQITTNNVGIFTSYPIDRIVEIIVNDVDITNRVVERDYYETLDNMANYTDRAGDNKNNHLWYERGKNEIGGVTYIGAQFSTWAQATTNRAIYEVIACELESTTTYVDEGMAGDRSMTIKITYTEMSEVEAHINKDDISGFEERMIRKINANERVNNAELLGAHVRTKVNAIGNTKLSISGYGTPPNFGSISPEGYRVVNVTEYTGTEQYAATLVKDHIFESEYIGIDSDRRLYIVPKDNVVRRRDVRPFEINFSKQPITRIFYDFDINENLLLGHLRGDAPASVNYASINIDEFEIGLPISIVALGSTITLNFDFLDNYNAGYQRIESGETTYQRGVRYTDRFGRADNIWVTLEHDLTPTSIDKLPERLYNVSNNYLLFETFKIIKDAREAYSYSAQFIGQSRDADIIVYDGFAKYSRLVNGARIKAAKIDYTPSRDDRYINPGAILEHATVAINSGEINVSGGKANYAWYNVDTLELIMVLINGDKIYYNIDRPLISNIIGSVKMQGDIGFAGSYFEGNVIRDSASYVINISNQIGESHYLAASNNIKITATYKGRAVERKAAIKNIIIDKNYNEGVIADLPGDINISGTAKSRVVMSDYAIKNINLGAITTDGEVLSQNFIIDISAKYAGKVVRSDAAYKQILIGQELEINPQLEVDVGVDISAQFYGEVVRSDAATKIIGLDKFLEIDDGAATRLEWTYWSPWLGAPITLGYNPIGTTCSIEGDELIVAGSDIGMSGNAYRLICKKV